MKELNLNKIIKHKIEEFIQSHEGDACQALKKLRSKIETLTFLQY